MFTPVIEINLRKISHNARTLKKLYGSKGIDVVGVTKVVCGNPLIADGDVFNGAFGPIKKAADNGLTSRLILGIGLQDVLVSGLISGPDIDIIGSGSDHIIINNTQLEMKVGNTVEFGLNYGALLAAMTSQYVTKNQVSS